MAERIVMRTAEALVEGDKDYVCIEPEIVLGELDGPVGTALATLLGDQVKGHTRVFAILNSDVQVKPATLMVSKVTVKDARYTGILMGTLQAGIAHGVLDAVRAGDIPKEKANDLGIIYSAWLDPAVLRVPAGEVDHAALFAVNREATAVRLWHVGPYRYGWEDAGSTKEQYADYTFHLPAPPYSPASLGRGRVGRRRHPGPSAFHFFRRPPSRPAGPGIPAR